jgi:hypothetical protein
MAILGTAAESTTMKPTQERIVNLLAYSTLLPSYVSEPILAGNVPPLADIVDALLTHALDCEATVTGDSKTTMNERRIARAVATVAFLAALALHEDDSQLASAGGKGPVLVSTERSIGANCKETNH